MSQSVEPLALNGNRLNLSVRAGVLAYWVKDTPNTGASATIDPVARRLFTMRGSRRPPRREASHERRSDPPPARVAAESASARVAAESASARVAAESASARAADLRDRRAAPQGAEDRPDHDLRDRGAAGGQ